MGRIGRVLDYERPDIKIDIGGGDVRRAKHMQPNGDDSHPLPQDFAVTVAVAGTGQHVVVGYYDPLEQDKTQPGDKRIYSRDSGGASIADVWLKSDGSVTINNGSGTIVLQPGGQVVINETCTVDTDGTVTAPKGVFTDSLIAGGKEIINHNHRILSGSSAPGPTDVNS